MGRIFLFLFTIFSMTLSGFNFQPITMKFSPSGKDATKSFKVSNPAADPIAVQVSAAHRIVDIDGQEEHPEADDDFIIVPSQLVLLPGEEQTVQVTWAGPSELKQELAYRLIAEQLPIMLTEPDPNETHEGAFQIMLKYVGAIYILPSGMKDKISLFSFQRVELEGENFVELVLENTGTRHGLIRQFKLNIGLDSEEEVTPIELSQDDILEMAGLNMLAGAKRRIRIPWPEELPVGDLLVEASFNSELLDQAY